MASALVSLNHQSIITTLVIKNIHYGLTPSTVMVPVHLYFNKALHFIHHLFLEYLFIHTVEEAKHVLMAYMSNSSKTRLGFCTIGLTFLTDPIQVLIFSFYFHKPNLLLKIVDHQKIVPTSKSNLYRPNNIFKIFYF